MTTSRIMAYDRHHPDGEHLRKVLLVLSHLTLTYFFFILDFHTFCQLFIFPHTLRLMGFECKCEGGVEGQTIYSVLILSFRWRSFKGPACKIEHHLMVGGQTLRDGDLNALLWSETLQLLPVLWCYFIVKYKCLQILRKCVFSHFYLIWYIRVHFPFNFMHSSCSCLCNVLH